MMVTCRMICDSIMAVGLRNYCKAETGHGITGLKCTSPIFQVVLRCKDILPSASHSQSKSHFHPEFFIEFMQTKSLKENQFVTIIEKKN